MTIQKILAAAAFAAIMAAGTGSALAQGKALGACSDDKGDKCAGNAAAAIEKLTAPKINPTVGSQKQTVLKAAPMPAAGQAVDGAKAK